MIIQVDELASAGLDEKRSGSKKFQRILPDNLTD